MKKKIKIILSIVLIIAGLIVGFTNNFNLDIRYDEHKELELYLETKFEKSDIDTIMKEVFNHNNYSIEKIGTFEEVVQISIKDINDEQKENLKQLISEKYGIDKENVNIDIVDVPKMKVIDIFKNSIITIIISIALIVVYYIIRYRSLSKVAKMIINLLVVQALFFSIIVIIRLPINIYVNSLQLVVLVFTIFYSTNKLDKEKEV